ncbi:MAG TPA: (deoxy)nucleoside triphosphate pyrophosphohydrolase [Candidatus Avacidaminococcus intestinavium]|uniref:8-oxo-dGTP diphosphatase n=1 Tax=Candidatus Avacidaminococcus intestinavium TaxID=2840684 RepID=A0A9D1MNJ0_9FIRM|nr:(deoxy)nucleoside triphosphate pyrophosphohydrolase [Candidatus Avacidaminococcus intestinavium]
MKVLEVVAGIVCCGDEILCLQRGNSKYNYIAYKYEFPGGKIEQNELPKEALRRELSEELALDISIENMSFFQEVSYTYPDFAVHLLAYTCFVTDKNLEIKEHSNFCWLTKDQLDQLDWLAGDWPLIEKLRGTLYTEKNLFCCMGRCRF